MLPVKSLCLAEEFTERYFLLTRHDHKTHQKAINLLADEFKNKIDQDTTDEPCFFFIDKSGCDFVDGVWEVFGEIN